MFTWYYRLNALASWAAVLLVVMLSLNYISGQLEVQVPPVYVTVEDSVL